MDIMWATDNVTYTEGDPLVAVQTIQTVLWAPKRVAMIRKTAGEMHMHMSPAVMGAQKKKKRWKLRGVYADTLGNRRRI